MRARVVVAPALVVAWASLVDTGIVRHRAVAGPLATIVALADGVADGSLALDTGATLARALAGVGLGVALGAPLGVWSAARERGIEPWLDFLRAIPPLLVFPLLLLAFGYGEAARVLAVGWAAALVVSMHVAAGAARASRARHRALIAMGAGLVHRLRWLHLYELLPPCATGLRHALGTAMVVAAVGEMIVGAEHGLGARAVAAQVAYDAPGLYAVVLATGVTGLALSRAAMQLERRLTRGCAP